MSNYQNEAGEWLMDAAAIRLEQHIDEMDAYDRAMDYDQYGPDEDDAECDVDYDLDLHDGHAWCYTHDERAEDCEAARAMPDFGMEDQHLDGSYEE